MEGHQKIEIQFTIFDIQEFQIEKTLDNFRTLHDARIFLLRFLEIVLHVFQFLAGTRDRRVLNSGGDIEFASRDATVCSPETMYAARCPEHRSRDSPSPAQAKLERQDLRLKFPTSATDALRCAVVSRALIRVRVDLQFQLHLGSFTHYLDHTYEQTIGFRWVDCTCYSRRIRSFRAV